MGRGCWLKVTCSTSLRMGVKSVQRGCLTGDIPDSYATMHGVT